MKYYLSEKFIDSTKELIRKMKITCFLLFVLASGVLATPANSQVAKVSVNLKNATVAKVIDAIEGQTDYLFVYSKNEIDLTRTVSVNTEQQSVAEVLSEVFDKTNVVYAMEGTNIMLMPRSSAQQQGKKVSGKVTDQTGASLPGVSVVVKGTTTGVITDNDGSYSLTGIPQNATLQFSFVGMKMQEILIGNQTTVNVVLADETIGLEEVVAIGYGTIKRSSVTAAITSIAAKDIKDMPTSNAATALQGKLPGVIVQQTSGNPGSTPSIKVRGFGSISAGTSPLIVVDGNIVSSSVFATLTASEIENIDVLKDASSTAIYGSRGSNGVIMVTTKRGKSGKTSLNLDVYTGFQQVTKKVNVLNSQQFAEFAKEASNNAYLERVAGAKATDQNSMRPQPSERMRYPQGDLYDWFNFDDASKVASMPYHDFQSEIFRDAPIHNYQLTTSGGNDKIRFLISGGYMKQDGIVEKSTLDRYTFRTNIDVNVTSKFKLGLDINPSYRVQENVSTDGHWASNGIINAALASLPMAPIYSADGSQWSSQQELAAPYSLPGVTNAIANISENNDQSKMLSLLGNAYAEYQFLPSLKYRMSGNMSFNDSRRNTYRTSRMPLNQLLPPNQAIGGANSWMDISYLFNQTLSFSHSINEVHNFDALLGMESTKYYYENSSAGAISFPNDVVQTLNYGTVNSGSSFKTENSVVSYFGRLNYDYMGKYLINASVRRDGSSLFGPDNRWGTFPAASIAWRATKESFMENYKFISETKIRASYGLAGNNAFSNNYPYVGLLKPDNYVLGNQLSNGLGASSLGNTLLGWEKSRQTDLGIDLGFFNNRIYFIADYYHRLTTDLLLNVNVPTLTGFSSTVKNIGEMENKGWEFSLSTRNLTGQFTWNTNVNVSFNRNKVIALGPTGDPIRSGSGVGETNITVIGEPIGNFYGYKQIGIFNSQADLATYPHFVDSKPGDVKYEDVSGAAGVPDGKIDANDRTIIGNNQPKFIYGFTNTFSFKGFELNVVFNGVQGGKILNLSRRFFENLEGGQNNLTTVLDRWRSAEQPGNGIVPRANSRTTGQNNAVSSRWVENGSFLRIQNITLGYKIPQMLLEKVKIQSARIYLSAQNPVTWSKYLGYNPEVSGYEGALTGGVDYGSYPLANTFIIGLNLGF